MIGRILEGTATLVLVYLILTNAQGFSTAASAAGKTYVDAVKTLQGR